MMIVNPPEITRLAESDVQSILARNHVGRLAFVVGGDADIRPLHFVHSHGMIYCRTTPDARLTRESLSGRVAFEVDEVESVFYWKSVIARGHCHVLTAEGADAEEWTRATELLRKVVRDTFKEGDPVPGRTAILRIAVDEVTGMECR
jgi:nitroimidazol reductase NimA-like FMN-containing flavoprotein (pyridoxamine 5'-phosphate oxidase superfamily)